MSIVLRYVDDAAINHEHFLTYYVEAAGLTAEKLTDYIINVLDRFKLDPQSMVSQEYNTWCQCNEWQVFRHTKNVSGK